MNEPVVFKAQEQGANRHGDVVVDGVFSRGECRYGLMKWLTTDYGVGQNLALYGEYFEGEVAIFRRFIRPGDVVISAGGNIGVHLVPLSQIVGEVGRVITFEPQAFLRPVIDENLRVNGCANVELHPEALGEAAGTAMLPIVDYAMPNNFGGLGLVDDANIRAEAVPVIAIDSLKLQRLDFLMLDVEGYELAVLKGARATINKHRPLLYVEIDKEDRREPLLQYITRELRYEVMFHLPYVFNPDNFAGNSQDHFGDTRSIMCLGVPT